MTGLCVHGGWPLATGLTVKEPEHCICGERHGFKEVSTYLSSAVTSACSEQAHTHSFAPRGQLCCSPRSTQALHTSPHEGHSIAIIRTSNVRSVHQVPCQQSILLILVCQKASCRKRQHDMQPYPAISHAEVNRQKENLRHVKAVSHTLPQIFFLPIHTCQYRTSCILIITLFHPRIRGDR